MSALEIQALGNQSIATVIEEVALSRWSSAVSLTLLLYDTFLTLGDEITFLWPKKWSVIRILTHLNRIIAFTFIMLNAQHLAALRRSFTDEFCEVVLISTGVAAFVSFALCNWILLARTKALFSGSKIIKHSLSAFFVLCYGGTAVLVYTSSNSLINEIFYSKTIHVCGIAVRPPTLGFVWVAPMVFETTMFILTIYKLYKKATATYEAGSNLLIVLYRDGVVYYLVIICLRVFNLIAWMILPTPFVLVGIFLLWAIMTIAVTRLQINLVKAVDPSKPVSSSSFLPGLRRVTQMGNSRTHLTSRNTVHASRRYAGDIQLYSIKESRTPTQIQIVTQVQTVTFQDDELYSGRGSKASNRANTTEEGLSPGESTVVGHEPRTLSEVESGQRHPHRQSAYPGSGYAGAYAL